MAKLKHIIGALPFFIAVFLNAFVDLGHKIIIQNTVYKLYEGTELFALTAFVNALILIPFILLLSPAGFLSDRYTKTAVMRYCGWAVVICTLFITAFYYLGWFWPAFIMTFLLAAQSAIYSPAKFSYIKELFGKERLGSANGIVASLSIVAILAGIFVYTVLFEIKYPEGATDEATILKSIAPIAWLLVINAIIELFMIYRLPTREIPVNTERFSMKHYLTGRLFNKDIEPFRTNKAIRLCVIGLATFWSVGQVMLAAFPAFIKAELNIEKTTIVQGILACSGVGIAIGSIVAGRVSRHHIETGLLPIGAMGVALGLWLLPNLGSPILFALDFLFIGVCGGIFIVPLNALIQFSARTDQLGKTLAASNWVQNIMMLLFLAITTAFALANWQMKHLLYLIAAVAFIGCLFTIYQLPQSLARFALTYLMSRRYRLNVQGMKNIPASGGVLMLGNHVSWIDWAIVQMASPRPVRFVMINTIYQRWYLKWFFDLFNCIPISQGPSSRNALVEVARALDKGEVVCLFPEGTISRTGHLAEFRKGYERACAQTYNNIVILPFYIRGLWGSQFSRSSSRLKQNSRSSLTRDLVVAFGNTLPKTTSNDVLKRRVLDLSITSWKGYVETMPNIEHAWLDSTKKMGRTIAMSDTLGTTVSGYQALTGALTIARRFKSYNHNDNNIGLLLPTSVGGMLANMASLIANKTIVNINYTASEKAIAHCIKKAKINHVYSSLRFAKKLKNRGIDIEQMFIDTPITYLEDIGKEISFFEKTLTLLSVKLLPSKLLSALYLPTSHPEKNAAVVFSSGSEGLPKGVEISHKNIMANIKQIADVLNSDEDDCVLANLPLFHAFGLTATQFMPLLEGLPVVCHPDPTDVLGSAKAIAENRVTLLFGTSTFLRLYNKNKKIHPLMLSSLKFVIAGAEKLNSEVRDAFTLKYKIPIFEGYGATETTPVASVNLPDKLDFTTWKAQLGAKQGSVGMPLPGSSCMVVNPEDHKELPTGKAGMVLIGGPQVMKGYLDDEEKTQAAITVIDETRWYITGDKGFIDEDGFLFIVDRYSRFAKLGGEMVSLSSVENTLQEVIDNDEIDIHVTTITDEKKGEALVVLTEQVVDSNALQAMLKTRGLNTLAIPRLWFHVDAIPTLGSGKTDFAKAKRLAIELAHTE